ncbi:hypothetical protein scyTo_0002238 [Scyliorhinus torazame]|uniref:CCHC-type domain-containing protein n=1 Tax=Scyliorhinus torazame TaxID=75743 RepID=A0A401PIG7_SCYTO|nr:hypothetical protein [Scyliorhinus torazame]
MDARKIALFLSTAGDHAIHIYNSLTFADGEDKTKFKTVLLKFDSHCDIEVNESFERYVFQQRLQGKDEPFQSFVTHLHILAQSCNYDSMADSMIRDQIVFGIHSDSLRQQLLTVKQLTLSVAIETCIVHEHAKNRYSHIRAAEAAKLASHEAERVQAIAQMQDLNIEESGHLACFSRVPAHARHDRVDDEPDNPTAQVRMSTDRTAHARWCTEHTYVGVMTCPNCGFAHLKRQCPAIGRWCLQCGKLGHYAALCRSAPLLSSQRSQLRRRSVRSIQQGVPEYDPDSLTDPDAECLKSPYRVGIITTHALPSTTPTQRLSVLSVDPNNEWSAVLTVNKARIRFKLDTGALANLISISDLDTIRAKPSIFPPACQLFDYNGNAIAASGSCQLGVSNKAIKVTLRFEIVRPDRASLLGARACKLLNLVQRVHTMSSSPATALHDGNLQADIDDIITQYHSVFDGMGTLPYDTKSCSNRTPPL